MKKIGKSVLAGIATGAVLGGAVGGLSYVFPAFFASSYVTSFGFGFSLPFIADSFSQGKNAQGAFRVFTGLAIPLAVRNAAIARLAATAKSN